MVLIVGLGGKPVDCRFWLNIFNNSAYCYLLGTSYKYTLLYS